MKINGILLGCCLVISFGVRSFGSGIVPSTAFTYQGALVDSGEPADGFYDLVFSLHDTPDPNTSLQWGEPVILESVDVVQGYFTVELDFGLDVFNGESRWLEIGVRPGDMNDPNAYAILEPRQKLTPAPQALYAQVAGSIAGAPSSVQAYGPLATGGITGTAAASSEVVKPSTSGGGFHLVRLLDLLGSFSTLGFISGSTVIYESVGNVGIGTTNPQQRLHVEDDVTKLLVRSTAGRGYTFLQHDASGNVWGTGIHKYAYGDAWGVFEDSMGSKARLMVEAGGNVGIGITNPYHKIHVSGSGDSGDFSWDTWQAGFGNFTGGKGEVVVGTYEDQPAIQGHGSGTAYRLLLNPYTGNVGIGTTNPTEKLDVAGTTRTQVLEITGGADMAEPFDIADADAIEPGMVVCIDPENPGQLRLSEKAYDPTVAGIISGANGIKSGLTMRQEGSDTDGSHPVALTGRVYCLCDAAYGPISPGDMLTTSDTPGHAMKAADQARAFGTILGKAMSRLDEGEGLVLVLVSLQ